MEYLVIPRAERSVLRLLWKQFYNPILLRIKQNCADIMIYCYAENNDAADCLSTVSSFLNPSEK